MQSVTVQQEVEIFRASIDTGCLLSICEIILEGDPEKQRPELLQNLGYVLGCLGTMLDDSGVVEETKVFGPAMPATAPATLEGCCEELRNQLGNERAANTPAVYLLIRQMTKKLVDKMF